MICKSQAGPEPWAAIVPYFPGTLRSVQEKYEALCKDESHLHISLVGEDMVSVALDVMQTVVS